ncbi:hypothetical protein TruAng_007768 [Truncatella angustata]|nr:hypothetical protein TruAng_007768 [Truncatella angustata]
MPHLPPSPILSFLALLLALSSLAVTPALAATKPKNAILLSDVQSLTLRSGAQTTHRRVPAAPQLKCVSSPPVCALHDVGLMRCTNQGSGYGEQDIQWSCAADLPPSLKLGATDVVCEGYARADDEYMLKGSCGVEYRLVLTEEGERRYPHLSKTGGGGWSSKPNSQKPAAGPQGEGLDWSGVIFFIIFVAVLVWIVYSACVSANNNSNGATMRRPRNGGGGGGNGGGGWGPGGGGGGFGGWGSDDPPPPYPGSKPNSSSSSSQQGWRPGFFSGAATGAAAGYMAGNRAANRTQREQQRRDYGSSGYGGGGGSSSWFSGGSPSSSSSSHNDNDSSSSTRYESTGFGGTSRR